MYQGYILGHKIKFLLVNLTSPLLCGKIDCWLLIISVW